LESKQLYFVCLDNTVRWSWRYMSSFHWYHRPPRRQRAVSCFWSEGSGIAGHERVSLSPLAIVVYLTWLIVRGIHSKHQLISWNKELW